ncbi:DUF3592 domain-containing protein [Pedobacter caeni]|uniref:Uncharacterized protein n=1 Tax=Pedobacter caeni TaxID=288992 RepID=A0A1M5A306_9SPHI|nr:DUF3592 domain-containing protein [Pedobacter caeni]SHF24710.1 Protein of unknown function [Pedobacter caeni]
MKSSAKKIASLVFIVLGILLLAGNLILSLNTQKFIRAAEVAKGIVIDTKYGKFHPEIKFTAANHEVVSFRQGGLNKGYNLDEEVEVLYGSGQIKDSRVNDFWALWGMHIIFLVIGLVFLVSGGIKFRYPDSKWLYFNFENQKDR